MIVIGGDEPLNAPGTPDKEGFVEIFGKPEEQCNRV